MRNYQVFVVFFFLFHFVPEGTPVMSKAAIQETKKMMKNMCKRSSGVKQESLNQYKNGIFVDDSKLKCYMYCCLKMMKAMRDNKLTVAEAVKQVEALLPEDLKEPSLLQLNACKDVEGTGGCEIAFKFAKCCYEKNPNNMLIPA